MSGKATQHLTRGALKAGLQWTGHALVDVGIAGACAYAKRWRPEDHTLNDLDEVSKFIVETYYQAKLGTYLSCVAFKW